MVKVETEAPALWRKPPETATPSTLDKRASPRLYLESELLTGLAGSGDDADSEESQGIHPESGRPGMDLWEILVLGVC